MFFIKQYLCNFYFTELQEEEEVILAASHQSPTIDQPALTSSSTVRPFHSITTNTPRTHLPLHSISNDEFSRIIEQRGKRNELALEKLMEKIEKLTQDVQKHYDAVSPFSSQILERIAIVESTNRNRYVRINFSKASSFCLSRC